MSDTPITDEQRSFIEAHVARYIATDGREGAVVEEDGRVLEALLLTTVGRRSGEPRTTALYYGRDGDRLLVVASLAGHDRHPQWYLNLQARPRVGVQIGPDRFRAIARAATPAERPRLWAIVAGLYPVYDEYQARTARTIPVVVLDDLVAR